MVTLADALLALHPTAVPGTDYKLCDDGAGPQIVFWAASLGPQPTPAQLAAVTEQQVADAVAAKNPDKRDLLAMAAQAIADLTSDAAAEQSLAIGSGNLTAAQLTTELRVMAARQRRATLAVRAIIKRLIQIA